MVLFVFFRFVKDSLSKFLVVQRVRSQGYGVTSRRVFCGTPTPNDRCGEFSTIGTISYIPGLFLTGLSVNSRKVLLVSVVRWWTLHTPPRGRRETEGTEGLEGSLGFSRVFLHVPVNVKWTTTISPVPWTDVQRFLSWPLGGRPTEVPEGRFEVEDILTLTLRVVYLGVSLQQHPLRGCPSTGGGGRSLSGRRLEKERQGEKTVVRRRTDWDWGRRMNTPGNPNVA